VVSTSYCSPYASPTTKAIYTTIRTVDGVIHGSFQAAAVAMGIVEDVPLFVGIFEDFEVEGLHQLRLLFANLTVDGYPTFVIYDDIKWRRLMVKDLTDGLIIKDEIQDEDRLLQILQQLLRSRNRELSEFGLTSPQHAATELQRKERRHT
jgi:hypothetical protein